MSDPYDGDTLWPSQRHTRAKHEILKRYLDAWLPILSQLVAKVPRAQNRNILYVDGFAGPGEYEDGEPGSPLIALGAALHHKSVFPIPVSMAFIEKAPNRYQHLQTLLQPLQSQVANSRNVADPLLLRNGDCDTELNAILDESLNRGVQFGPALAFLDQFGYGDVPMSLVKRILSFSECEVFTFISYTGMNRWITHPGMEDAFTRAFGDTSWQACRDLADSDRRTCLLDAYIAALRRHTDVEYIVRFSMYDKNDSPLYWLIFCTNNLVGLEKMKAAMWGVDSNGGFRFSDRDAAGQLSLLSEQYNDDWLAEELSTRLAGSTLAVAAIKKFVMVETPCYLFKKALSKLEKHDPPRCRAIDPPAGRKVGNYPDERLLIEFAPPL